MWMYLYFMYHLKMKDETEYNGLCFVPIGFVAA